MLSSCLGILYPSMSITSFSFLSNTRLFLCGDSKSVRTFMALPSMALSSFWRTTSVSSPTTTFILLSLKNCSSRALETLSPMGGNCMGSPMKITFPPRCGATKVSRSFSKLPVPNSNSSFCTSRVPIIDDSSTMQIWSLAASSTSFKGNM